MRIAQGLFLAVTVLVPPALAHHPGSHAARLPDGRVKIEAYAMATDSCTRVGAIRPGTPAGVTPPPNLTPMTVRLERRGEACATVVTPVRVEAVLDVARSVKQIILYIESPDGSLAASERVPVQ